MLYVYYQCEDLGGGRTADGSGANDVEGLVIAHNQLRLVYSSSLLQFALSLVYSQL